MLTSRLILLAFLLAVLENAPAAARERDPDWTQLFNGRNFEGWYSWLEGHGINKDPDHIFQIENGAVHVYAGPNNGSKQPQGYICTHKEYGNYVLQFEYKWGKKRFQPRAAMKRDAGLMYHVFGPDLLWPSCIECQVQETDTGDFVMVGTTLSIPLGPPSFGLPRYQPGGKLTPGLQMHVLNKGEYNDPPEDSLTEWNRVEVRVSDDRLLHVVNGVVNNFGVHPMRPDPQNPRKQIPLTKGRIIFQAESAEVYYRNIRLRPLTPQDKLGP